jgi:AcrR family transcriptional regulator
MADVTRATPMTPDARRRALVAAARPLIAAHGPEVSTKRIAEAAGVAEGTIFRVFDTKADLIAAVLTDSFSPDALVAAIENVPQTDHLPTLVSGLLRVLRDDMESNRGLHSILTHPDTPARLRDCGASRYERGHATGIAIGRRLKPFSDELTLSLPKAAVVISAVAFVASPMLPTGVAFDDLDDLTTILLHGIAKD